MRHAHGYRDLYGDDIDRVRPLPGGRRKKRPRALVVVPAATAAKVVTAVATQAATTALAELAEMAGMGSFFSRIGRGLKKVGKAGLKVAQYTTPVGLAYTAIKKRRALLKLAGAGLRYGTPIGLAFTAGKAIARSAGGSKRRGATGGGPPAGDPMDEPGGDGGGGDEGGADDGGGDEGGGGGDDQGDELEEGGEGGGGGGGSEDEQAEMEGLGLLGPGDDDMAGFFSFVKTIGKGIGKGAKAVGKVGVAVGKVGVKIGGQIAKNTLATYLGPGNVQAQTQALSLPEPAGFNWKSPIVLGAGAAVLVGGALLLRKPGPAAAAPRPNPRRRRRRRR